ncbi:hypothetical protein I4U23_023790 [Adineta vaga]|nr:hypothetical protein I4U23_023790 [Adineta vaga]
MSLDKNEDLFPFADYEFPTDIHPDLSLFQKPKHHLKTRKKPKDDTHSGNCNTLNHSVFYLYFEHTNKEKNFLVLSSYTGPSNTLHLGKNLYIPRLISTTASDSSISFHRFVDDYDRTIELIKPSLQTMPLSVYIRFGILYGIRTNLTPDQPISLTDFTLLRNRGKQYKTSFYTCKGVTTPKMLLNTITKLEYQQISANTYSYEVQLYGTKSNPYSVLHFRYDEQLRCCSVYFQPNYPMNFDFIRDKTSSRFHAIDNSYSDIFDFRVQLSQGKILSKTDPNVLGILRSVPINAVLSFDSSTHVLYISPKLQKFVKYFKCIRSTSYQNFKEQLQISICTYEEFQLNRLGQCEPVMTASNTMTIELLNVDPVPSAKKLYDIGMWFSNLCQTCVELPSDTLKNQHSKKVYRWFSDILKFGRENDDSVTEMNVDQLTRYTMEGAKKSYTSEELGLVKKILHEENLRNIFFDKDQDQYFNKKELRQRLENLQKKLETSTAPSANQALKKLHRIYHILLKELN